MDVVRFEIGERIDPAAGPVEAVRVVVNDRDLRDLAWEIELPFARRRGRPDLAGDYAGLPPEAVFSPSRRLLGRGEYRYDDWHGKVALLGCVCGSVGCSPLLVSVEALEDRVVWSGFEQPHRKR